MSSNKYKSTDFDRNLDSFEFGAHFSDTAIEEEINRNPLAYFWTFGVTKEALSDGFDLLDEDGNILPIQEQLDTLFEETRYLDELIQLVGYVRAYGKAGQLHFSDGSFKAFRPKEMRLEYDLGKREFIAAELDEWSIYVDKTGGYYTHYAQGPNKNFSLKDFVYWYFFEKDKTLEGRSELEPIWDIIQGLFICAYLSPLVVAQTTGLKIMKSNLFSGNLSADKKAEFLRPIRDMSHKLALGMGITDELEIKYPPNNTFIEQTVDMLFSFLASATGYPKEAWRGNQLGNQSGAVQTTQKVFDVHKTIQKLTTTFVKKSLKIQSEILGYVLPEKFTVEWRFKQSMSEEQESEILTKKASAVQGLSQVLTGNEIRELLGKTELNYFDDEVPLSASQNNDIGINVTGLEPQLGIGNVNNEPSEPDKLRDTANKPPEPAILR